MAHVDLMAGARRGVGVAEKLGRGFFVHVFFTAVVADLRGHGFHDEREACAFEGDGGGASSGLALFADGAFLVFSF